MLDWVDLPSLIVKISTGVGSLWSPTFHPDRLEPRAETHRRLFVGQIQGNRAEP